LRARARRMRRRRAELFPRLAAAGASARGLEDPASRRRPRCVCRRSARGKAPHIGPLGERAFSDIRNEVTRRSSIASSPVPVAVAPRRT
jgi:hypothetical protein